MHRALSRCNNPAMADQSDQLHPVGAEETSYGAIDPLVGSSNDHDLSGTTVASTGILQHSDSYHALVDLTEDEASSYSSEAKAWRKYVDYVVYLSEFAILGSVLRVFLGRFFGKDCEAQQQHPSSAASLFPFSLCLTHSGKYGPGGSIFIDLPANLLGSFIMGMLNPLDTNPAHAMPWFHRGHILQTHDAFVTGLRTGVCGSLTTFSSWNTQMVVMMNGTDTALGPQIGSAVLGYLIGFFGAAGAYLLGSCLHNRWSSVASEVERRFSVSQPQRFSRLSLNTQVAVAGWTILYGPLIFCAAFFLTYGIMRDRTMLLTCAVSPFGAILRWKLGQLNEYKGPWKPLEWMPWGTFLANMLAVALSISTESTNALLKSSSGTVSLWIPAFLSAMQTGFGGSLSTVSTWLKEIYTLQSTLQASIYALGTVLCAVTLGLAIYSHIIASL